MANNVTAELSLLLAILVSVAIAAIASRVPALAFGSFTAMLVVLVLANLVVYVLTKIGLFKGSSQSRP